MTLARAESGALPQDREKHPTQNVLLVILDDVGVDKVGAYGEHTRPARTNTLNALARRGVLFRNAWANPYCSPTRATLMTGRYAMRTGIGSETSLFDPSFGLKLEELCLPEAMLKASGHRTALFGKWHLSAGQDSPDHPRQSGFELAAGSLANLDKKGRRGGGDQHKPFSTWIKFVDGESFSHNKYATTDTVDDALHTIELWADEPWFLTVSFNSAHKPYHKPPAELHDVVLSGDPQATPVAHHRAMVESMDRELGRLLDGLGAQALATTHVIVIGDNGTQNDATELPFIQGHGGGTLFEGGIRVPLIVAGPAVSAPGKECRALVNSVDIFETCLELGGSTQALESDPERPRDSISLVPYLAQPDQPSLRQTIYSERFAPNHKRMGWRRAIRGPRFKLVLNVDTKVEHFFDLERDPFENNNLVLNKELDAEQSSAYADLKATLAAMR